MSLRMAFRFPVLAALSAGLASAQEATRRRLALAAGVRRAFWNLVPAEESLGVPVSARGAA
jgi:hypothetical protein